MSTAKFGNTGVAGPALFVLCCAGMHVLQPELSAVDDAVSYYLNGRYGWVLGLGLVALGAGSLAIAYGFLRIPGAKGGAGVWLLAAWGAGAIIGGIFPPDPRGRWDRPPSMPGIIHGIAAMVAFPAFPAAARRLSINVNAPGARKWLRRLARLCGVCLAVFFVCLAPAFANRPPYALGLVERVLLALYVAWLVVAGVAVSRTDGREEAPQTIGRGPLTHR